jgi:hypothetical protein
MWFFDILCALPQFLQDVAQKLYIFFENSSKLRPTDQFELAIPGLQGVKLPKDRCLPKIFIWRVPHFIRIFTVCVLQWSILITIKKIQPSLTSPSDNLPVQKNIQTKINELYYSI